MTDRELLEKQLRVHESERLRPYPDIFGNITIGVGRNLTGVGISKAESQVLLTNDIDRAVVDLASYPWFVKLTPVRQRVLIDMRFNLGPGKFREFTRMLAAAARGDDQAVANEMVDSEWIRQVKTRGVTLVRMWRSQIDPFAS